MAFLEAKIHVLNESVTIAAATPATIKDITDSYRRLNAKAAVTVFLIYDVAFAMVMSVKIAGTRTGIAYRFIRIIRQQDMA